MIMLDAVRARTVRQLADDYREQSRIYRRAGGSPFDADPVTPEQAAAWEARVWMWCIWYHLGEETGRRTLADALREERWSLGMIDGIRHDRALGEQPDPVELAREVAELRRQRAIVTAELKIDSEGGGDRMCDSRRVRPTSPRGQRRRR